MVKLLLGAAGRTSGGSRWLERSNYGQTVVKQLLVPENRALYRLPRTVFNGGPVALVLILKLSSSLGSEPLDPRWRHSGTTDREYVKSKTSEFLHLKTQSK